MWNRTRKLLDNQLWVGSKYKYFNIYGRWTGYSQTNTDKQGLYCKVVYCGLLRIFYIYIVDEEVNYPWRCLWRGFTHTTRTIPRRRITLQFLQIFFTEAWTFIVIFLKNKCHEICVLFNGSKQHLHYSVNVGKYLLY